MRVLLWPRPTASPRLVREEAQRKLMQERTMQKLPRMMVQFWGAPAPVESSSMPPSISGGGKLPARECVLRLRLSAVPPHSRNETHSIAMTFLSRFLKARIR